MKGVVYTLFNRMIEELLEGVEFISVNTDAQSLLLSDADVKGQPLLDEAYPTIQRYQEIAGRIRTLLDYKKVLADKL